MEKPRQPEPGSRRTSEQRKTVGRHIKAARRALGHKSARAFAHAIGVSESSIANAERGAATVGAGVYMDIETALDWPTGCIERYLDTGDPADLPSHGARKPESSQIRPRDGFEREVISSPLSEEDKIHWIRRHRAAMEEEAELLRRIGKEHPNVASPGQRDDSDASDTRSDH